MKTEKCKNCAYYVAYYRQWNSGYGRLIDGACSKHRRPQKEYNTCEDFKNNGQSEERKEKSMLDHLECALISLNDIAHILKEKNKQ